jgi:nucleotide-binding universal stress UspA family protein
MAAAELATRWAQRFEALVAGLGILDEPSIRGPQAVPVGGQAFKEQRDENRLADARAKVAELLARFTDRCREAQVACRVMEEMGTPFERILRAAQRYDLLMLGTQTHFHFETEVGPGETLDKVLESSPRPVVAVPENLPSGTGILVAYDGRPAAARSLQALVALGLGTLGHVEVVSVDRKSSDAAAQEAELAAEYLGSHGIAASSRPLVSDGRVEEVLLEESQQQDVELLVMGAYGSSKLSELFLGSTTRRVLQDTRVPLFLSH